MFDKGDFVFFKKAKRSSHRRSMEFRFEGHGMGIYIGEVPLFASDPPATEIFKLLGTVGLLTFDDIGEFLGPEMAADCVKKFEDKYWGKKADSPICLHDFETYETSVPPGVGGTCRKCGLKIQE